MHCTESNFPVLSKGSLNEPCYPEVCAIGSCSAATSASQSTLQCPPNPSLIARIVGLNAHMAASVESLLQRGGAGRMWILQPRDSDAPGQKAIDRNCPAAPKRNDKPRPSLVNWTCKLGALFRHPVAKSRDGLHTKSRIPATDCSCWSSTLNLKPFYAERLRKSCFSH